MLLAITGMRTVSEPMVVAVSATAKMFAGDIVETGMPTFCNFKTYVYMYFPNNW